MPIGIVKRSDNKDPVETRVESLIREMHNNKGQLIGSRISIKGHLKRITSTPDKMTFEIYNDDNPSKTVGLKINKIMLERANRALNERVGVRLYCDVTKGKDGIDISVYDFQILPDSTADV